MFKSVFNSFVAPHRAMDELGNHPNRGIVYNATRSPTTRMTAILFGAFMTASGADITLDNTAKNLAAAFGPLAALGLTSRLKNSAFHRLTKQPALYFDPNPPEGEKSHRISLRQFETSYIGKTLANTTMNFFGLTIAMAVVPQIAPLIVSYAPAQIIGDGVIRMIRHHKVRSGEWLVTSQPPPPTL